MEHLNQQQREAVTHKDGPALVIAGAGTGKTRVITERIAYMLDKGWCKNNEILGLTFTDKAAGEMEERLDTLMPIGYEAVELKTFHSFCDRILRDFGIDFGIDPSFRILQGVAHWQFMKDHLFDFEFDYYRPLGNPNKFIEELIKHFSRLKEELVSPKKYLAYAQAQVRDKVSGEDEKLEAKKAIELAKAYVKYQELLQDEGYLDFADLHFKVIEFFENRPNILNHMQNKYKFIMVDEYQDTNIAQNKIVDMLAGKHRNLMVVGDDDQSIYKFRGAAISNILQFQENYLDLKKIVLTENYRSNQKILDFAYLSVSNNNPDRLEVKADINKKLNAQRPGESDCVRLVHCSTIEQEVEYVIDEIGKTDVPLSEIAILVRANNHARPFIEDFKRHNIPYQSLSEKGLYDKDEVKDMMAVLRVIANPTDDISFYRVLRMPYWKLEMEEVARIIAEAKSKYSNVWSVVKKSGAAKNVYEAIKELIEYSKNKTAGEVLYKFIDDVGLYEALLSKGTIEAEEMITNIATFFGKIRQFEREDDEKTVIDYIRYLDLAIEAGENPSAKFDVAGIDGVQILTVHSAKGLEYNTVFLSSLVNRRFPSDNRKDRIEMPDELVGEILSSDDFHNQEERRLFYVAITRAKENLHLMWSDYYNPSMSKNPRASKRSRFIEEVIESADVLHVSKEAHGAEKFLKPKIEPVSESERSIVSELNRFSYSQLDTFEECPRKYHYSYVLKIPTPPSASLSFGSTMHNTLQEFYNVVRQSKQASLFEEYEAKPSLERLLAIYKDKWIPWGYESKEHHDERKKRGRDILNVFYDHFNEGVPNIEFLEKAFKLKLGKYMISGRIDRADRLSDGSLEIIDYKTGKTKSQKDADKDKQLMIYAMASKDCFGKSTSKLTLYFLDDDIKVTTEPDNDKLENTKKEIISLCDAINESGFEAKPSEFVCKYCPYRKICDKSV